MSQPRAVAESSGPLATFKILVGTFGIALIAASWRLWLPPESFPAVPLLREVPLFGSPAEWPSAVDYVALAAMLVGLVGLIGERWSPRYAPLSLLYPVGFAAAVVLDQHRLQPWAYQFAALVVLVYGGRSASGLRAARILAVGIYLWSAIGKFDFQFAHTVGAQMISAVAGGMGIELAHWPESRRAAVALLLPLGEWVAAALLAAKQTRRIGVVLAVVMHLGLVAILGPWGLDHQPGVLLWNGFFIGQAIVLFWPGGAAADRVSDAADVAAEQPIGALRIAVLAVMLALPLVERSGYFDHWPSWALYAPHSSRANVLVTQRGLEKLPPELAALASENADPGSLFVLVPIDRWSLETLRVPIYPQARFQLGVAIALARRGDLDRDIHVLLRGPADRWTGRREAKRLVGLTDLLRAADEFTLGALPRAN